MSSLIAAAAFIAPVQVGPVGQAEPDAPLPAPATIDTKHLKDIDSDNKLGKEYAAEVAKEMKVSDDQRMQARVQRIGAVMAQIANTHTAKVLWGDKRFSPFNYTFTVIKGDEINAFSLPGGHIYVYEGLVNYVESDDELAGVLGHEISHAAFRHVATLQHEASKLSALTLPLVLIGILAGGGAGGAGDGLILSQLVSQAKGSGWSQNAELAADFGGFQWMLDSPYNPVGMLTVMERMARDERLQPTLDWGIFRDHPPSAIRAERLTEDLKNNHIAIRRSLVASSLRAEVRPADDGSVEIWFNKTRIYGFSGNDALTRADQSVDRLNAFFDQVPELFEVRIGDDGNLYGQGKLLVEITDDDAATAKVTKAALADQGLKAIRGALYSYAYRVWDQY